ncbi:MAG: PASTA domain-containing protein [Deltaproteobacteria bacterium]
MLLPGELVIALHIPAREAARGSFLKLGARRYLVISIAMVALIAELTDGRISHARLAIGACGPAAIRLPPAEAAPARTPRGSGAVAVPTVQGLAARAALRRLEAADLAGDVRGSGRVTGQVPRAGERVERGTRVRLTLAPPG